MSPALRAAPLLATLALAACEPVPPPAAPEPDPAGDACGASGFQTLVGQGSDVLAAMTFPEPTRVYNQGDALTMDFNPGRLNIEVGPDGTIARVWCG